MRLNCVLMMSALGVAFLPINVAGAETGYPSVRDHVKKIEAMANRDQVRTVKVTFKDPEDLLKKIIERSMYRVVYGQDLSHLEHRLDLPNSMKHREQEISGVDLKQMVRDAAKSGMTFFSVERIVRVGGY